MTDKKVGKKWIGSQSATQLVSIVIDIVICTFEIISPNPHFNNSLTLETLTLDA